MKVQVIGADRVAAAIAKSPDIIKEEVRIELKTIGRDVVRFARQNHRFQTQTGNLERSITAESLRTVLAVDVLADIGTAPYAEYVHDGHGSWAADEFIYQAVDRNMDEIEQRIEKAVGRGIEKAE